MLLEATCETCKRVCKAGIEAAGRMAVCPKCGGRVVFPDLFQQENTSQPPPPPVDPPVAPTNRSPTPPASQLRRTPPTIPTWAGFLIDYRSAILQTVAGLTALVLGIVAYYRFFGTSSEPPLPPLSTGTGLPVSQPVPTPTSIQEKKPTTWPDRVLANAIVRPCDGTLVLHVTLNNVWTDHARVAAKGGRPVDLAPRLERISLAGADLFVREPVALTADGVLEQDTDAHFATTLQAVFRLGPVAEAKPGSREVVVTCSVPEAGGDRRRALSQTVSAIVPGPLAAPTFVSFIGVRPWFADDDGPHAVARLRDAAGTGIADRSICLNFSSQTDPPLDRQRVTILVRRLAGPTACWDDVTDRFAFTADVRAVLKADAEVAVPVADPRLRIVLKDALGTVSSQTTLHAAVYERSCRNGPRITAAGPFVLKAGMATVMTVRGPEVEKFNHFMLTYADRAPGGKPDQQASPIYPVILGQQAATRAREAQLQMTVTPDRPGPLFLHCRIVDTQPWTRLAFIPLVALDPATTPDRYFTTMSLPDLDRDGQSSGYDLDTQGDDGIPDLPTPGR